MDTPGGIHRNAMMLRFLPSVGPALLIGVGYIDPAKWAAILEGGAHFGFDILPLLFVYNCIAILCQYLAARIAIATGKNLAQICGEEYCTKICILLATQTEMSAIVLELTMVLSISHGLNLMLGWGMFPCLLLAASSILLFPILDSLAKRKLEASSMCMAGLVLLYYVLVMLSSEHEFPALTNGILLKVGGDDLYIFICLLGANVLPHYFYLHSSIVQKQEKISVVSPATYCYDQFLVIIVIFSAVLLANYAVACSAVATFQNAGIMAFTFQDILALMDQIFGRSNSMAPFTFFMVFICASSVRGLACSFGSQIALRGFLRLEVPVGMHFLMMKSFVFVVAFYHLSIYGSEGLYQLLVVSQVLLALQLPSSVIPLFRVASSASIMGPLKVSSSIEMLSLVAFFGMLALNILFIVEMLFGDCSWIANLNNDGSTMLPFTVVLLTACSSLCLMLWLAATPLKSARERPDQGWNWDLQSSLSGLPNEREEVDSTRVVHPIGKDVCVTEKGVRAISADTVVGKERSLSIVQSGDTLPGNVKLEQGLTTIRELLPMAASSSDAILERLPAVDLFPTKISARTALEPLAGKMNEVDTEIPSEKDENEVDVWEPDSLSLGSSESLSPSIHKVVIPSKNEGKSDDLSTGSGSVSRLSGLGRAARKQFATVLNEFWGKLFDFHGQITPEAKTRGYDIVLGLRILSSAKMELYEPNDRSSGFLSNDAISREYDCLLQSKSLRTCGVQGTPSWSSSIQSLEQYGQSSGRGPIDMSERPYSSLCLPAYSEIRDYQPATIHGYQISSYLNRVGTKPYNLPGVANTSFGCNNDDVHAPGLTRNQFSPSALGTSNLQSQTLPGLLQGDRSYADPSPVSKIGSVPPGYSKKYHSLPDISVLGISRRDLSIARTSPLVGTIGPGQPFNSHRMSVTKRPPLAFDEISPSKIHKDAFSLQSTTGLETNSLWCRQPVEQLFQKPQTHSQSDEVDIRMRSSLQGSPSQNNTEAQLLRDLQICIMKLLKLEGSDWLFRQNGGSDEGLIDLLAVCMKFLQDSESKEHVHSGAYLGTDRRLNYGFRLEDGSRNLATSVTLNCGDKCIWRMSLVVSFGVWSIHRILDLSLVESRPELWGQYTYVLNRLQGILDLAFSGSQRMLSPCSCLQIPVSFSWGSWMTSNDPLTDQRRCTSASNILDMIKDVEQAIASRKGRSGTAAGDIAFPKGKENLASVLKRYKRRLSNKPSSGSLARKNSSSSTGLPTYVS